jgi:biotin synthase-like enzyme
MVFSEIFWGSVIVTLSGLLLKIISMSFKSKCSECSFCGISIKRNVDIEEKEHEFDIIHQVKSDKESGST